MHENAAYLARQGDAVSRWYPGPQDAAEADSVFDAAGLLVFPGVVDAHMHFGTYNELAKDITSESRAAALGGVTTGISYMRTGQYYLNRGGSVAKTPEGNIRRAAATR